MRKTVSEKNINKIPKKPGVYFLKNKIGEIFYIGKANNLHSRIQSHFRDGKILQATRHDLQPISIEFLVTANEIEALLKESVYIKKYNPRMNYRLRDDKKYFYVGITNEYLPRVFITHQPDAESNNQMSRNKIQAKSKQKLKLPATNHSLPTNYLGPYTDGAALKQTMKYLRKIFPYYTTSRNRPLSSQKHKQLACSWCHLKLCPGPKPNSTEYKKNIKRLKNILQGRQKSVITSLKKEMKTASVKQNFEEAQKLKNITEALENIFLHRNTMFSFDSTVENRDSTLLTTSRGRYLMKLLKTDLPINSIEGYDVSNIQGQEPTASMVRFYDVKPDKSMYRKFNIHSPATPDDYRMISEALERRLKHTQWAYPDMILIDGGRGHLNAALKVLKKLELTIPIVSLAKREEELYLPNKKPIPLKTMPRDVENLLKYVRDEAHRFAILHHRVRHRKTFLPH